MTTPLIDSAKPLTHMVSNFCEIRVPESEVDHFEEHPDELGLLVLAQWSRCAVVVAGIIYEDDPDDGEENW